MHVHLYEFQVAYADYAVAYLHQLFFEPVYVGEGGHRLQVNDEIFGAVGKLYLAEVEVYYIGIVAEFGLFFLRLGVGGDIFGADIFARNCGKEAAHYSHKPHAAAVYDARLLSTGRSSGVWARASSPTAMSAVKKSTKSLFLLASLGAASLISLTTVKMVPSLGFETAL